MPKVDRLFNLLRTVSDLLLDALRFILVSLQPRYTLAAENLFLRKQLALYLERRIEPRRPGAAAKLTLVLLSRLFPWRQALTIVKPDTFPLASARLSTVLEVEIAAPRAASHSRRTPEPDRRNG